MVCCFRSFCSYSLPISFRRWFPLVRRSDVYQVGDAMGFFAIRLSGTYHGVSKCPVSKLHEG